MEELLSPQHGESGLEELAMSMTGLHIRRSRARTACTRTPASTMRPTKRWQEANSSDDDPESAKRNVHNSTTAAQKENVAPPQCTPNIPAKLTPSRLDCIKDLRDELTCGVCLEVLVRPCSTFCGHTFCRRCLRESLKHSSVCPKCRAVQPKDAPLKINTALWNTIQLLFPAQSEPEPPTPEAPIAAVQPIQILGAAPRPYPAFQSSVLSQPFRPPRRAAPAHSTADTRPPPAPANPIQGTQPMIRPVSIQLQAALDEVANARRRMDALAPPPTAQQSAPPHPSTLNALLAQLTRDSQAAASSEPVRQARAPSPTTFASLQHHAPRNNPFVISQRVELPRNSDTAGASTGIRLLRTNSTPAADTAHVVIRPSHHPSSDDVDDQDSSGLQLLQRHSADLMNSRNNSQGHGRGASAGGAGDARHHRVRVMVPERYQAPQQSWDTVNDQDVTSPAAQSLSRSRGPSGSGMDAARQRDQAHPAALGLRQPLPAATAAHRRNSGPATVPVTRQPSMEFPLARQNSATTTAVRCTKRNDLDVHLTATHPHSQSNPCPAGALEPPYPAHTSNLPSTRPSLLTVRSSGNAVQHAESQPTSSLPSLSIAAARAPPQLVRAYSDWTGDDDPTADDCFEDSPFFDELMYQDARRAMEQEAEDDGCDDDDDDTAPAQQGRATAAGIHSGHQQPEVITINSSSEEDDDDNDEGERSHQHGVSSNHEVMNLLSPDGRRQQQQQLGEEEWEWQSDPESTPQLPAAFQTAGGVWANMHQH